MNLQAIQTVNKIKLRKIAEFDFERLKKEINLFFVNAIIRNVDLTDQDIQERRILGAIRDLRKARSNFDHCLSIFKNNFELEYNSYIQDANKTLKIYDSFNQLLGVANARLDIISEKIQDLDRRRAIGENTNYPSLTLLEDFKETLFTFMSNLIIYPLKETLRKYYSVNAEKKEKIDGEEKTVQLVKDQNFFFWLLFREINSSAQIEGSVERQASFTGKYATLKQNAIPNRNLDLIPQNAVYEPVGESEAEKMFNDSFAEEQNLWENNDGNY